MTKNRILAIRILWVAFVLALLFWHAAYQLYRHSGAIYRSIPWHSAYLWPLGAEWWILPIIVVGTVAFWWIAYRTMGSDENAMFAIFFVPPVVVSFLLVGLFALIVAHALIVAICVIGFIGSFAVMIIPQNERNER